MLSRTEKLREEIERAFPERPFALRFWDGTEVTATTANGAPTFSINSPKACAHVLRAPGELGLGRAYIQGFVDVDDMDAAVRLVDGWRPGVPAPRQLARLGVGLVRACGLTPPPPRPQIELRLRRPRH